MMRDLGNQYEDLEKRFRKQVKRDRKLLEFDDIVYLPQFIRPTHPVDYVFIAMEPSLKKTYAGNPPNRKEGETAVKNGFRNFMPGRGARSVLHYCVKKYLCSADQTYYITDMSKGAMPVNQAKHGRKQCWREWFPLLIKELGLVAKKDATVFAIGKEVRRFLMKKKVQGRFDYRLEYLLHPSDQTIGTRKKYVTERKAEFVKFKQTVNEKDLIEFGSPILSKEGTPWAMKTKEELERTRLSDSTKMLIFVYKNTFEVFKRNKK